MKTVLWGALLAAVAGAGCFPMTLTWPQTKEQAARSPLMREMRQSATVRPEQVNADNAHEMAEDLAREMDWDVQADTSEPRP
jgi:hypothetical protein